MGMKHMPWWKHRAIVNEGELGVDPVMWSSWHDLHEHACIQCHELKQICSPSSCFFVRVFYRRNKNGIRTSSRHPSLRCCDWLLLTYRTKSLQASLVENIILPPDPATELADLFASFYAQFAFHSCLQLTSWEHSLRKCRHWVLFLFPGRPT